MTEWAVTDESHTMSAEDVQRLAEVMPVEPLSTHTLENDPPHGLSRVSRMTCTVCGAAVLQMPGRPKYGGATERTCEDQLAYNKRLEGLLS